MSRDRMSAKEVRKTARSLHKSLESTLSGLSALLTSLENSGLKDALAPYQQMQLVLIQQRLWGQSYDRKELTPLWRGIADTCTQIHAILAPFSALMAELKGIDQIETLEKSPPQTRPPKEASQDSEQKELFVDQFVNLILQGTWVSNHRVSRRMDSSEGERKAHIQGLLQSGVIERRGWGRSQSFRLTPDAHRKLKEAMLGMLNAGY